jgi:hypothetical protein
MAFSGAKINFQPASSSTPSGYLADSGKTFTSQNGLQYGWTLNNTGDTRDRKTSADDLHDTLIQFNNSKWEIAVPNGSYTVTAIAGDPGYIDSKFVIAAEGKTLVSGTPTNANHFVTGSATVQVNDGRLTVGKGSGAVNNKLVSLTITPAAVAEGIVKPNAPTWISSWGDTANTARVQWNDVSNNESGFIIERSLDNRGWTEVARVGSNVVSYTATGLNAKTKYYFRVKSFNAAGTSTASPVEDATTLQGTTTTKPVAVTGVSVTANGATSATVKWKDVANESGYRVQRSTNNSTYSDVGTVSANVTTWADNSLSASTKYYYRIQAYNSAGTSTSAAGNTTTSAATIPAPKAPSWLGAQAVGSNAAALQWGDVTTETGYIIEKSSNGGSSFGEHARVGAGVTNYTASGLTANTSYVFRVKAYNAGGSSAASVQQTIRTTQVTNNPSNPSPVPSGTNPTLAGICINNGDYTDAEASEMRALGIKAVRVTMSVDWSQDGSAGWYAQRAIKFHNAGFKVVLCVMQKNATSYSTAKTFFSKLANNSTLRNAVDYWEIGNEPNIGQFWTGSQSQFIQSMMKPAYESLKAVGETVVGGSVSWDANYCKQLQALGYGNYCDIAGFHPYGNTADEAIQRARDAKAAFGNKPIMFTEWSVPISGNTDAWVAANNKAAAQLANIGMLSFYYALNTDTSRAGAGGLLSTSGARNTKFYNMVKDWLH